MENISQHADIEPSSDSSASVASVSDKARAAVSTDNSLANSTRPLPIARIQSDTAISGAPSWAEIERSATPYAPQYAPLESKSEKIEDKGLPRPSNLRVDALHPHPSYVKHKLSVSPDHLAALARAGEPCFRLPIIVTRSGVIIDGYARWELARRQHREKIVCLEYDLTDEEALRWLIQTHSPSKGLNGFCRSLLALDLEPVLQEAARANQRTGGQMKGSSNLTEAQKVDVRSEVAAIANVSIGNVPKAKRVLNSAVPEIQRAARVGEISVHKAWKWSSASPQQQLTNLEEHRSSKGPNLVSRRLIQKHVAEMAPTRLFPPSLGDLLRPLSPDQLAVLDSIVVSEIDSPGQVAYLTMGAMRWLRPTEGT